MGSVTAQAGSQAPLHAGIPLVTWMVSGQPLAARTGHNHILVSGVWYGSE
jgi:hypothetical protein